MPETVADLSKQSLLNRHRGLDTTDPPGYPIYDLNNLPTPPTTGSRAIVARDGDRLTLCIVRGGRWVDCIPRSDIPQQEIAHVGASGQNPGDRYTDRQQGGFRMFKDFYLGPLAAAGTAYHDPILSDGTALSASMGWTQFLPNRSIRLTPGGGAWDGGNVLLDVEFAHGFLTTLTVPGLADGVTTQVDVAVNRIIRLRTASALASGRTLAVETGPGFGVMPLPPFEAASLGGYTVSVDGVVEAPAIVDRLSGTIVPTSVPNGARRYLVRWVMNAASHYPAPV